MHMIVDPDATVTVSEMHECASCKIRHKNGIFNPNPNCTCTYKVCTRQATPEERAENKRRREAKELAALRLKALALGYDIVPRKDNP